MGISCKSFGKMRSIEQKLFNKRFSDQKPKEDTTSKKKNESSSEKKK